SEQQEGFFNIPLTNISFIPLIVRDYMSNYYGPNDKLTVVAPDSGGVTRARRLAKLLNDVDLAIIDKRRPKPNESVIMNIIGNVEGRRCILIDDLIDTAGTLCNAANALKERGATEILVYCTHPVLSGKAYERLAETASIDELIVSDTIPLKEQLENIRVVSISQQLANAIERIMNDCSMRELV
ncbi:MAG: ribose-phosphate pyrophosphokinase, partial [Phototrophicales bacterium]